MKSTNHEDRKSHLPEEEPRTSKAGKWCAIVGSVLIIALPITAAISLAGIYSALEAASLAIEGDIEAVTKSLEQTSRAKQVGGWITLAGVLLMICAMVRLEYRRPWLFYWSVTLSIFGLLLFPLGTLISICFLFTLFGNKDSFFTARTGT